MINIFQNNQSKFDRLIYISFILLPLFLISGPLLPEIVVILICIYAILKIKQNQKYRFFLNNKYFIILFLFWINGFSVSLLSYFDLIPPITDRIIEMPKNIKNLDSLINSFFYFRYLLFSIGVIIILSENKELLKAFLLTSIFCFIILFVDGFYQLFNNVNLFGYEISQEKRVSSFFGDELVLGSYTLRILIIIIPIFFLIKKNFKLNSLFFFILIFIALCLIIISGERTALLLYFLAISLYLIYRILSNKETLVVLLLVIFSLAFSLKFESVNKRFIDRTLMEINNFQFINQNFYVGFAGQQLLFYETAINISKEYPLGVGNKNFKNYCLEYRAHEWRSNEGTQSCSTHPHNIYFNVLVDNGIQGFVIIVGLFLVISYKLLINFARVYFKKDKTYFQENLFLIGIFVNFFPIIQHGSFFNNWLSVFYYLSISIYLYYLKNKNILQR